MNNHFVRKVLWTSLVLSFVYSLSVVSDMYIIQHVPESQISIVVDNGGNHSLTYGKEIDLFRSINGSVQTVVNLPIYPLLILGGFGFAIVMGYIGPILIFISWFIILYILSFVYFRLIKKSTQIVNPVSNKKLIIICIIGTVLLSFVQFRLQVSAEKALFAPQNEGNVISITPRNAKIGDTIKIILSDADHEGYSYVSLIKYLEPGKGYYKKGTVWIGKIPEDNTVNFVLKGKNCFDMVLDERCDLFVDAVPDTYKLRIQSPGDSVLLESDFKIVQ